MMAKINFTICNFDGIEVKQVKGFEELSKEVGRSRQYLYKAGLQKKGYVVLAKEKLIISNERFADADIIGMIFNIKSLALLTQDVQGTREALRECIKKMNVL